jgi:hypothetical protein
VLSEANLRSPANPSSLLKLCCLQQTKVCGQKSVVYSESAFAAEIVLFAANQHLLLKMCSLQRIRVRCQNCVVCSELVFAAESVLSAANPRSMLKLCCLQRTGVRLWKCVVSSKFVIRCQIWVVCGKLAFTAESVLAAASWHSLLKVCCL